MEQSIQIMKNNIIKILQNNNISIYLYGSVVLNDFKLGWSDIDFLCITEKTITKEQAYDLIDLRQKLLSQFPENQYFGLFEGGLLTLDTFINKISDTVVYWGTSGQSITDSFNFDPFSMIELLENGRLLYGDDIRYILEYPTKTGIQEAIINHYNTIRKYAVTSNESLYSVGWLFDIARCIYTLRSENIIAKTQAGEWALENKLIPNSDIMEKALLIRKNPNRYKTDINIMKWTSTIGNDIQKFADVLEEEINHVR